VLGARNYGRVSRTIRHQNLRLREQGERLERAKDERGRLLRQVVGAEEDERKRIALELHDGPIQDLTALDFKLEPVRLDLERAEPTWSASVQQTQEKLREEIQRLRSMIVRLRPPALDERGLKAALADHARSVAVASGVECVVDVDLEGRLDPAVETIMYRVAQEALANVTRHAAARRAEISVRASNGCVVLEVRDDGDGFDPSMQEEFLQSGHFGLMGMRERVEMAGGNWRIDSRPGGGTYLRAEVPR
jgi:signal transduction histidine kinase